MFNFCSPQTKQGLGCSQGESYCSFNYIDISAFLALNIFIDNDDAQFINVYLSMFRPNITPI